MPSSSKPRKKYRPKTRLADPMDWVIQSIGPLREHDESSLLFKTRVNLAMQLLIRGQAGSIEMNDLVSAHNITQALVELKGYPDTTRIMDRSLEALQQLFQRAVATGKPIVNAVQMAALNDMVGLHDEFVDAITLQDMERAREHALKGFAAGSVRYYTPS